MYDNVLNAAARQAVLLLQLSQLSLPGGQLHVPAIA